MGLAFPALVVLLLLLPGVLLSYAYRRGFFRRTPVTLGPIRNEIGPGIVWALALHAIFLPLLYWGFGWQPDLQFFLGLADVADNAEAASPPERPAVIQLFWYLVGTNAFALLAGWGVHGIIRKGRLDLRYDWLRFSNEWYYLFSGEARIFQSPQADRDVSSIRTFFDTDDLDLVYVSMVVDQGNGQVLYWGVLADYFFDADGSLEKIVLERAQRRDMSDDDESLKGGDDSSDNEQESRRTPIEDERFYPIRGHFLIIRYQDVVNLNIEYLGLPEESNDPEGDEEPLHDDDV
jgi:hypothetical protein